MLLYFLSKEAKDLNDISVNLQKAVQITVKVFERKKIKFVMKRKSHNINI